MKYLCLVIALVGCTTLPQQTKTPEKVKTMGNMPSYSNFVNGKWQILAEGTLVEIENGSGQFSGELARVEYGPYGGDENCRGLPPQYNVNVKREKYLNGILEVNFYASHLRVIKENE